MSYSGIFKSSSYFIADTLFLSYRAQPVFTAVAIKNAIFGLLKPSSYLRGDILRLSYRAQPVNAI
jgi:hypothetical protein